MLLLKQEQRLGPPAEVESVPAMMVLEAVKRQAQQQRQTGEAGEMLAAQQQEAVGVC